MSKGFTRSGCRRRRAVTCVTVRVGVPSLHQHQEAQDDRSFDGNSLHPLRSGPGSRGSAAPARRQFPDAARAESDEASAALPFYGDGVKLVCEGSPVLKLLRALESGGASLIICRTCLEYFSLKDKVPVGQVGGMPAILDAMTRADKVMSV